MRNISTLKSEKPAESSAAPTCSEVIVVGDDRREGPSFMFSGVVPVFRESVRGGGVLSFSERVTVCAFALGGGAASKTRRPANGVCAWAVGRSKETFLLHFPKRWRKVEELEGRRAGAAVQRNATAHESVLPLYAPSSDSPRAFLTRAGAAMSTTATGSSKYRADGVRIHHDPDAPGMAEHYGARGELTPRVSIRMPIRWERGSMEATSNATKPAASSSDGSTKTTTLARPRV